VAVRVLDDTAEVVSRHALGHPVLVDMALADSVLYAADQGGTLTALDVRGPKLAPLWRYRVTDRDGRAVPVTTRPVLAEGLVLFGAADNCVHALKR
jgi:hypothetical protein